MAAECPTLGYHKIRGLGAPLRMMFYYKSTEFVNVAFGEDMQDTWFGGKKPELAKLNSCINLPYIVDGEQVVTQSNTCMLYLGQKLNIDLPEHLVANHIVLDQIMDLRNDLMKIVYPFLGPVKTKEEFPAAAQKHLNDSARTNFTKLEGFCKGPFMCGAVPQTGDFHVFEMLDQHDVIARSVGEASLLEQFPKLKALHDAMKADPALAKYFESKFYQNYAHNNAIYCNFSGFGPEFVYGTTEEEKVTF